MSGKYDDIIDLPHHTSPRHPRMPARDRAAQFAPFSALTGYGEVIDETARLTDGRIELSEDARAMLDVRQRLLCKRIEEQPKVTVVHFVADKRKSGGAYRSFTGDLVRMDEIAGEMIFADGTRIKTSDVIEIIG